MLQHLCRDVFAVHLQWAQDSQAGQSTLSMICPITDLRATLHPFAALRPCGHVLSMRALQQVMLGFLERFADLTLMIMSVIPTGSHAAVLARLNSGRVDAGLQSISC